MVSAEEDRRAAPKAGSAQACEAWAQVWGDTVSSIEPGDLAWAQLERWWLQELDALPDLVRALEIGAGACAFVSNVLIRRRLGVEVIASDFRDPPSSLPAGVQYVGGAAIEALPFPAGRFDAVVSQFGFEYADLVVGVAELARVIRPGGYARLVMHHPESFFARRVIDRVRCLEAGTALLDAAAVGGFGRTPRKLRIRQVLRGIDAMIDRYSAPPVLESVLLDLLEFPADRAEDGRRRPRSRGGRRRSPLGAMPTRADARARATQMYPFTLRDGASDEAVRGCGICVRRVQPDSGLHACPRLGGAPAQARSVVR